ncbi:MAG: GNAT family N-acetyltransferase [SAR324 cluster bacterium]
MALLFGRRTESALPVPIEEVDGGEYGIVQAQPEDLPAMDRIEHEAFSTPWSLDLIRGALVNHRYRVRVMRGADGRPIAFYIAHTTDNQSNLDNLAVTESSRRKGCGRRLVVDWIAHARRQRLAALTLQVNTRNLAAERLYRAFSFRRVRLLAGYYPNGEDAYQMEREMLL